MSMHDAMSHLNHVISHHVAWGYFLAFFFSFLESLAVVGSVIPGAITMTAVGVMIGSGILNPWLSFCLCVIGALLGDSLSFYWGAIYQDRLVHTWPFSRYPTWLEKGRRFFAKYGVTALIIGRFFGPMRSMVPLVAGALQMTINSFALGIVPSAFLWAAVYLGPGVVLGALSTSFPSDVAIEILFDGFISIVLFWAVWECINLSYDALAKRLQTLVAAFAEPMKKHRWGLIIYRTLEDPLHPDAHHQLYAVLVALFTGGVFLLSAWSSSHGGFITGMDIPGHAFFTSLQTHTVLLWTGVMAVLGHHTTLMLMACLMTGVFVWQKHYWRALHMVFLVGLTNGSIFLFKHGVHRCRPDQLSDLWHSFSFPSGHTAGTTAMVIFLSMLLKNHPQQHWIRPLAWLWIVLMGLSRLIMGVHWPSDIFGGVLLGLTLAKGVIISYQSKQRPSIHPRPLLWRTLACFALSAAVMIPLELPKLDLPPKAAQATATIARDSWWQPHQPVVLPAFRQNRFAHPASPFNLQYSGDIATLEQELVLLGWQRYPVADSLKSMVIRHKNPRYHLPLNNLLHLNKAPALIMIQPDSPPVILRLWQSNVQLSEAAPIWIGTVNRIRPDYHRFLPHWHYTRWRDFHDGLDRLFTVASRRKFTTIIKADSALAMKLHWNHQVLLIDGTP